MVTETLSAPLVYLDASDARQAAGQCDCNDCDCACAEGVYPPGAPLAALPAALALRPAASAALPLAGEWAVHYGPAHQPAVLNGAARGLLAPYAAGTRPADRPTQTALERLWRARLLVPADAPAAAPADHTEVLTTWITITDQCPLRCSYCYVPPRGQTASRETVRAIVDATVRSAQAHGYARVKFKYGGGEPLLKWPLVEDAQRYARQAAAAAGLGLEGVVLSNGVLLTPAILEQMRGLGLRLMISLDGLGPAHDGQRHAANGAGSFGAVERAVGLALEQGVTPDISITVSGRNAAALPDTLAWVLAHDLPFSVNLYRENDFSAGDRDLAGSEDLLLNSLLAAYQVIEQNLPRRSLLGALADRANLSRLHLRTCGAGEHYLAYDCEGRAAKCQMQLGAPVTTVAAPDPLGQARAAARGLHNLPVDEKAGCRACEWKYWCGGGCPLVTQRATGRYDVPSPHCRLYRAIYPAIMRLEGLRLLKYGATGLP
jgi:uncharacterized protein